MKSGYVYILSNKRYGTLYIGVSSDLVRRIYLHKEKLLPGFTNKYNINKLVYYAQYDSIVDAIVSEKKLKNLSRIEKIKLIEKINPNWRDLYDEII